MSHAQREPGLSALLAGERWQTAAWRAVVAFALLYVLPVLVFSRGSRLTAFLQILATVIVFLLTATALFRFLQLRAAEVLVLEEEPGADVVPHAATPATDSVEAAVPQTGTGHVPLETLGQAALERLCIALYRFNGLSSQTIATGGDGSYRIRLMPRNAEQAFAILQCHAGSDLQDYAAFTELLRVMEEEGVGKAFFVAPAGFTADVTAEARARHVTLVDLKLLQAMIDRVPIEARASVLDAA